MRSVIEELYYGNIGSDLKIYKKDSPFVRAAELKNRNLTKLMEMPDESGKEIPRKYRDAQAETEGIAQYDNFTYALKFGILLMTEMFMNSWEITEQDEEP